MAIRVALSHQTVYRYSKPVILTPQLVRLRPAPHCRTPIPAYSMKVHPKDHFINWQQDAYANYQARLVFPEPACELNIAIDLIAELTVINPFDFFIDEYAEHYPFVYDDAIKRELAPYLEALPATPRFAAFVAEAQKQFLQGRRRAVDVLVDLNQLVQRTLRYDIRMEPGVQTPDETLLKQHGSCRDFTWLMVQLLRHVGLAARFVSGYSIQLVADQKPLQGPAGVSRDVTDLHAWTEVYLPGAGWIGLDSTSGLLCGEGHIPLAATAEPSNAAPITGGFAWAGEEGEDSFCVEMNVTRIHEDPRVTKPYTEEEWLTINALGREIDAKLTASDVRLTMGGEPTFVSIDDMDGPEWNTQALGLNKRRLSGILIKRLRKKFAPGGLLHYGQGKWYPGESLPRFALGCYWRRDGLPIWENTDLIADESAAAQTPAAMMRKFILALADRLNVDGSMAMPAYEDVWYYLWKERRLPANVDPLQNQLANPEDRARLAKVFEQGLDRIVGYALPLRALAGESAPRWETGSWFLRPERMYLIPGDSPMGLRLPLDSLPWVAPSDYPWQDPPDPLEPRGPLPDVRRQFFRAGVTGPRNPAGYREQELPDSMRLGAAAGSGNRRSNDDDDPQRRPLQLESAPWIIRTALCTEIRGGRLHVFMPPQRSLEDYLTLVAQVEATAAELATPVFVEGYAPPPDPRLNHLKVTPDPGVIEVNMHPAHNWRELVENTQTLYEEARQSRLGTEKFQLDGRHTGTGGGNHIIIGGPTAADSPVLRRPDLLRSLVAYWNNHPSLSYLFSGMFIGPTSQAPRVDEGRADLQYEVQTALEQVPAKNAGHVSPWVVDRIFRNLLVDVAGNTHRAEFCIDKLYSPDTSSGRMGLVEFRGFEMPPHARMSLTQQLLLRSLIARFWEKPYERKLVRWGTELHDRFMLPHFIWQDFGDVIADLRADGYPLEQSWFKAHLEFRFPHVGSFNVRDLKVTLRQAIEPWHVLGEEPAGGGAVRYVDSSVERLEVKVDAMVDLRHVVTCNGRVLPLTKTGVNGQYVAGVRYKAWAPAAALHPTIGVHTPLVFDVVDLWNNRSAGGCTYHVSHPAGRNYTSFPVNALEAESRRVARFFASGHSQGPMRGVPTVVTPEFPFTLDLRRSGP